MFNKKGWFNQIGISLALIPGLDTGGRITQTQPCSTVTGSKVDLVNCTVNRFLEPSLNAFFAIITGLAIILLIIAGIQYIQALGNQDATKQARQRIMNIVLGIIILIAAYTIINVLIRIGVYIASLTQ